MAVFIDWRISGFEARATTNKMKFWTAALFAIFCNLQHGTTAADVMKGKSETVSEEEKIISARTSVASNIDPAVDDSKQDVEPSATETVVANSNDASELGGYPDDLNSAEYIAV